MSTMRPSVLAGWEVGRIVRVPAAVMRNDGDPERRGGYTHNAAIHLVDPEGRMVDIFDLGHLEQIRGTILRRLSR